MTEQLNIPELRRLHAAATPRPWHRFHDGHDDHPCDCGQIWSEHELLFCPALNDDPKKESRVNEGRLIVAMRNALPALLDAAEERDALKAKLAEADDKCRNALNLISRGAVRRELVDAVNQACLEDLDNLREAIAAAKKAP
jgi:hypothetical protein